MLCSLSDSHSNLYRSDAPNAIRSLINVILFEKPDMERNASTRIGCMPPPVVHSHVNKMKGIHQAALNVPEATGKFSQKHARTQPSTWVID